MKKSFLYIVFLILLNACDFCKVGGPEPLVEGDIYFSGIPLNANVPSIFRINKDGSELREVVKNGIIYWEPTNRKKMIFLKEADAGKRVMVLGDIDGRNVVQIGPEYSWKTQQLPIISSDGNTVAVFTGNKELWIVKNMSESKDNYKFIRISAKFCENTMPAFSPDGKKIAFYEGEYLTRPLTFKIFDITGDSPIILYEKQYTSGIFEWRAEASISWSNDNETVAYIISESDILDYIVLNNWKSNKIENLEVPGIGAYMPEISPDKSKIAFAGRDGNIWIRSLNTGEQKFTKITENANLGFNIYPQWSPDGKYLIYSRYYKDDISTFRANLELITVDSTKEIRILSNNAFRGFWNKR